MQTIDTSKREGHRDDGAVPALPVPPGVAAGRGYCSWDCYEADDEEEDERTTTARRPPDLGQPTSSGKRSRASWVDCATMWPRLSHSTHVSSTIPSATRPAVMRMASQPGAGRART